MSRRSFVSAAPPGFLISLTPLFCELSRASVLLPVFRGSLTARVYLYYPPLVRIRGTGEPFKSPFLATEPALGPGLVLPAALRLRGIGCQPRLMRQSRCGRLRLVPAGEDSLCSC